MRTDGIISVCTYKCIWTDIYVRIWGFWYGLKRYNERNKMLYERRLKRGNRIPDLIDTRRYGNE